MRSLTCLLLLAACERAPHAPPPAPADKAPAPADKTAARPALDGFYEIVSIKTATETVDLSAYMAKALNAVSAHVTLHFDGTRMTIASKSLFTDAKGTFACEAHATGDVQWATGRFVVPAKLEGAANVTIFTELSHTKNVSRMYSCNASFEPDTYEIVSAKGATAVLKQPDGTTLQLKKTDEKLDWKPFAKS